MIRLSYSALKSFGECERLFQLDRLLVNERTKEESAALSLGKAFGAGVQTYLLTQDQDKAIFECYKSYWPVLEEPEKARSEEHAVSLLLVTIPQLDNLLQDWEIATFNGKPAIELSFRLDIDHKFYYVGYVDVILKNRWNGGYAVGEVKTTGLKLNDLSPLYRNSGQALGYSIVLDTIVGADQSEYDLLYLVGQTSDLHNHKFQPMLFKKTILDRLNWFIALGMDVQRLHQMLDMNVFPMRGDHCLQYMRPCRHFGTCTLTTLDRYKEEVEDTTVYDFTFSLDTIVAEHLSRINSSR